LCFRVRYEIGVSPVHSLTWENTVERLIELHETTLARHSFTRTLCPYAALLAEFGRLTIELTITLSVLLAQSPITKDEP